MKKILKKIETPYVDAQTLLSFLSDYSKPREWILRMVKNGELIRLKNGFYLIAERLDTVPYEQIANLLYGPSYISLEWALSFYGLIPERVHSITSMTLGRNKEYQTPVGEFLYYNLSPESYSIGVTQKKNEGTIGGFLIASPEKALTDLVFKQCKGLNKQELKHELLDSKRIDPGHLKNLDLAILSEIAKTYRSKSVSYLYDVIGTL